jgi:DNA-3-methyladenine glycosylase
MARRVLARSFYERAPEVVAPELLNKVLVVGRRAARIVEVEAYRGTDDPASHAFGGPTPRAAIMFGPPGRLYVYLSYGVHWCANVVAHTPGVAGAVLLRAAEPIAGLAEIRADRPAVARDRELLAGPGRLCAGLGIGPSHLGLDVAAARSGVRVVDDGTAPPERPEVGPRVGISRAVEDPLRFSVPGHPHRSRSR